MTEGKGDDIEEDEEKLEEEIGKVIIKKPTKYIYYSFYKDNIQKETKVGCRSRGCDFEEASAHLSIKIERNWFRSQHKKFQIINVGNDNYRGEATSWRHDCVKAR